MVRRVSVRRADSGPAYAGELIWARLRALQRNPVGVLSFAGRCTVHCTEHVTTFCSAHWTICRARIPPGFGPTSVEVISHLIIPGTTARSPRKGGAFAPYNLRVILQGGMSNGLAAAAKTFRGYRALGGPMIS